MSNVVVDGISVVDGLLLFSNVIAVVLFLCKFSIN